MNPKGTPVPLYFIEPTEDEPIIFMDANVTEITLEMTPMLDNDDIFDHPEQAIGLFLDPDEAIEQFKAFALAKIAHLRAEADFLMDNLKSIQPMEDLK